MPQKCPGDGLGAGPWVLGQFHIDGPELRAENVP